jgi:hypothetical protein
VSEWIRGFLWGVTALFVIRRLLLVITGGDEKRRRIDITWAYYTGAKTTIDLFYQGHKVEELTQKLDQTIEHILKKEFER